MAETIIARGRTKLHEPKKFKEFKGEQMYRERDTLVIVMTIKLLEIKDT